MPALSVAAPASVNNRLALIGVDDAATIMQHTITMEPARILEFGQTVI